MFSRMPRFEEKKPSDVPPVGFYDLKLDEFGSDGGSSFGNAPQTGDAEGDSKPSISSTTPRKRPMQPRSRITSTGETSSADPATLRQTITRLQKEKRELEQNITSMHSERATLMKSNEIVTSDLQTTKKRLQDTIREKSTLESLATSQKKELDAAKRREKAIAQRDSTESKEVSKAKAAAAKHESDNVTLKTSIRELNRSLATTQAELQELKTAPPVVVDETWKKERQQLQQTIKGFQVKVQHLTTQTNQLNKTIDSNQNEIARLRRSQEETTKLKDTFVRDNAKLTKQLTGCEVRLQSAEESFRDLKAARTRNKQLEQNIMFLDKESKQFNQEATEMRVLLEAERGNITEYEIQLAEMRDKLEKLQQDRKSKSSAAKRTENNLRVLEEEHKTLKEELKASKAKYDQLDKDRLALLSWINTLKQTVEEVEFERDEAKEETNAKDDEVKEEKEKYQELFREHEVKVAALNDAQNQLTIAMSKETDTVTQLSAITLERDGLLEKADESANTIAEQNAKIEELSQQIEEAQSGQLDSDRLREEMAKELSGIKSSLNQVQSSFQETISSADSDRTTAKKAIAELEDENSRLKDQLAKFKKQGASDEEKEKLRQRYDFMKAEYDSAMAKYDALEARWMPYASIIEDLEAKHKLLKGEHGSVMSELERLASMNADLAGHQNQKQKIKYLHKLKNENAQLKKETLRLREELILGRPSSRPSSRRTSTSGSKGRTSLSSLPDSDK